MREHVAPRLRKIKLVRRGLAAKARNALRGKARVLFVCKGNICRSPFAAAVVNGKGQAKGLVARSAGSIPLVGRATPEVALQVAAGLGVDLSRHRSAVLGRDLADWADIVFIFDRAQETAIRAIAPELLGRTHYLGALVREGALEIADPIGGDEDRFRQVYGRIAELVDEICRTYGSPRPTGDRSGRPAAPEA